LRIGINALFLIPGKVGGAEFYLRYLVDGLTRVDRDNIYFLFLSEESASTFQGLPDNFQPIRCPVRASWKPGRILWEQVFLPYKAREIRLDVFHSTNYVSPVFLPCYSVVTIHDANYVHFPDSFSLPELWGWKLLVPLSARSADSIIAASKTASRDIVEAFGVSSSKIQTVYLAPHRRFSATCPQYFVNAVLARYAIVRPYILCVAASYRSKNIPRLLMAYDILKREYRFNCGLVLIGMRGRGRQEIGQCIERLQLENVVMPGWASDEELPAFYKGAAVFALPSLYEGFGMPILEAMACGTPVVTSNVSAMPEIAGYAALLVDPYSPESLAEGIYRVLTDQALREASIQRGLERARQFSWEKTARETMAVYEQLG
jgi:glycosyltransferase involved in cell wall biosynthesis